mgnify:CR=1 FL=1
MKKHNICSKKEMVLCQETALIRPKKGLRPVDGCAILIIEKGKPEKRPTLTNNNLKHFIMRQPSASASSWRLFPFILENLVNKTNKGNNEYQKLN